MSIDTDSNRGNSIKKRPFPKFQTRRDFLARRRRSKMNEYIIIGRKPKPNINENEGKNRKEWIFFFVCLILLVFIWQQLQKTSQPPQQSPKYDIFQSAASEHDQLHNSMLDSLNKINIDGIENPDEHQLLANLQHNLKKCQGISVAREGIIKLCDSSLERHYYRRAFNESMTTVTIIGVCIMFVLLLLTTGGKPFAWKKMTVIVLLTLTIAVALHKSLYWGKRSDMRFGVSHDIIFLGYEMEKIKFYGKYYPEVIAKERLTPP